MRFRERSDLYWSSNLFEGVGELGCYGALVRSGPLDSGTSHVSRFSNLH